MGRKISPEETITKFFQEAPQPAAESVYNIVKAIMRRRAPEEAVKPTAVAKPRKPRTAKSKANAEPESAHAVMP